MERTLRVPAQAVRRIAGAIGLSACMATLSGCGEPPALEVGRIGYATEEIAPLSQDQRDRLAVLTAFGLAVADDRLADVVAPYVERDMRSLLLQRGALELGANELGMDDEALRAAYLRDPRYELTVRHLVVIAERWRPRAQRDSARERAAEAHERAMAGEDFTALVAEYSDEVGAAERGGLLRPGREGSWVPEFWRAASSLEVGELSPVVETEYGYHVLRLEARDTVPFEEVRAGVLREVVGLSEALARSARWIEERTRGARIDTAAIRRWQSGDEPGQPLVSWPERDLDPFTAEAFDQHVRTLPPEDLEALRSGPVEHAVQAVEAAARNAVLLDHARRQGLEPGPARRAAVERPWLDRVSGWAVDLGFAPGQSDRGVKSGAMEALEPWSQDALIARSEVLRLGPVLTELYPLSAPPQP